MNTVFRPVNPVLDSLHIQGYCFHQTGWLYKEYRLLLFFAPHIQHAGLGLTLSLQSFSVGVHHPCIAPSHLQSLPYCNAIARPLRNIRPLTGPAVYCILAGEYNPAWLLEDGSLERWFSQTSTHASTTMTRCSKKITYTIPSLLYNRRRVQPRLASRGVVPLSIVVLDYYSCRQHCVYSSG